MKIVDIIKTILEEMVSDDNCELKSWQYNSKADSNIRLDNKMPSPTCLFLQITDFELITNFMTVKEKAHLNICFMEKENKIDSQGLEQDVIITRMKDLAVDFLQRLFEEKSLQILDDTLVLRSVFYRSDSNRTGVCVMVDVQERQGDCL